MVDVDWSSLFKSFYEKVRLKVACKNLLKIPTERLFEMDKKLYMINIVVEGYEQESSMNSSKDNGDDQGVMMKLRMMMILMTWGTHGRWMLILGMVVI
jgi:hypothetical protein